MRLALPQLRRLMCRLEGGGKGHSGCNPGAGAAADATKHAQPPSHGSRTAAAAAVMHVVGRNWLGEPSPWPRIRPNRHQ